MNIKEFMVNDDNTVIEVMELLDKVAKKVMFLVKDEKLVAAITDGDIRRWILRKGDLNARIDKVANYSPKYLFEKDQSSANVMMKKNSIEAIPIVDEAMKLLSVVLWNDLIIHKNDLRDVPMVMMAGGYGTRLYPYTKILPKPLIPIGEIPIAEHIINRFGEFGCKDFYLVVNHKRNMIKAYFNEVEKDYKVDYIDEDIPLGTGGGLSLLKGKIDRTFILSNCDILIDHDYSKILAYHKSKGNLITMVCSLKNIKIPYGIVEIGESGEIESMKEKPQFSFFSNTGMYIVEPSVIEQLEEDVAIGFPSIIDDYRKCGEKIGVYPISEYAWLDMGQLEGMEEMRKRLGYEI